MLLLYFAILILIFCKLVVITCFFQLDSTDEVKKIQDLLMKQISDTENTLHRINAPNMKAMEK